MKEAESLPIDRVFNISEKTHYPDMIGKKYEHIFNARLAKDIITNAKEVEPDVNWNEVIGSVHWELDTSAYIGEAAIRNYIAKIIGSVARGIELNMHSPEIVYMSVYALLKFLRTKIKELGTGGKNSEELERLSGFDRKITDSVEAYAAKFLPNDGRYRKIFQKSLFPDSNLTSGIRKSCMKSLSEGDLEKAYAVLDK